MTDIEQLIARIAELKAEVEGYLTAQSVRRRLSNENPDMFKPEAGLRHLIDGAEHAEYVLRESVELPKNPAITHQKIWERPPF